MIVVLGPTASGKTRITALAAHKLGGEIISADSRQIYRGMDLGTGKDIDDYTVGGSPVPFHMIDIQDAGARYSIFEYNNDFQAARLSIEQQNKPVFVCGGSGLYLETALGLYKLKDAPVDPLFREAAADKTDAELVLMLQAISTVHNTSDLTDRDRLLRAIEVARADITDPDSVGFDERLKLANQNQIYGISFPREETRQRITQRLEERLKSGMLDEVEKLLNSGIKDQDLYYYGLEYKYLTMHITGKLSYEEMSRQLNTAIHQFAKRQMTWFRRMEKRGLEITWLDGSLGSEKNAETIIQGYLS